MGQVPQKLSWRNAGLAHRSGSPPGSFPVGPYTGCVSSLGNYRDGDFLDRPNWNEAWPYFTAEATRPFLSGPLINPVPFIRPAPNRLQDAAHHDVVLQNP